MKGLLLQRGLCRHKGRTSLYGRWRVPAKVIRSRNRDLRYEIPKAPMLY